MKLVYANLSPIPNILLKKTPQPTFKADSPRLPASISPTIAPEKAPMNTPKGGRKIKPIIIPITEKPIPNLDAPYFFAPMAGRM